MLQLVLFVKSLTGATALAAGLWPYHCCHWIAVRAVAMLLSDPESGVDKFSFVACSELHTCSIVQRTACRHSHPALGYLPWGPPFLSTDNIGVTRSSLWLTSNCQCKSLNCQTHSTACCTPAHDSHVVRHQRYAYRAASARHRVMMVVNALLRHVAAAFTTCNVCHLTAARAHRRASIWVEHCASTARSNLPQCCPKEGT